MKLTLQFNRQAWRHYANLMRLNRPIGILLLLWPTLWALWIASEGMPEWDLLLIFCAGVVVMRSAGCIINDIADRDFDAHVKRTTDRPLAQGMIAVGEAVTLFLVLVVIAFVLVLMLNIETIILSVGAIILASVYPFMKRYTYFPQAILGAAFAWAIPMAFMAITQELPTITWVIYTSTLLWVLAYDTLYGMVDRDDDMALGLKSTAILFGEMDLPMVAFIQAMFMAGMLMVGQELELGFYYYIGWAIAAILIVMQIRSCRFRSREACFKAFLNNNYVGMALFLGIAMDYQFG